MNSVIYDIYITVLVSKIYLRKKSLIGNQQEINLNKLWSKKKKDILINNFTKFELYIN